jgi:hypothetical protein
MRVIHLLFTELSHIIGICPWCDDYIYAHDQYAYADDLNQRLHTECYIERKEHLQGRKKNE